MQITVGKNGTKLVLTKAEKRYLTEAGAVAAAVASHTNDPDLEQAAFDADKALGWLLGRLNAPAAPGSDTKAQDGKQAGGTPTAA